MWKGKFLSIGGRITLINSVLNSIPIYYISFFKNLRVVLKMLIRIKREFLWRRSIDRKGIAWVKWNKVCGSKEKGGLGLSCMEAFNNSLLRKLKWHFLLIKRRYGD